MFKINNDIEEAFLFSRYDLHHPLASCSNHSISLDERNWKTCEHYVQSMSVRSQKHAVIIETLPTAEDTINYVKPWYRTKIKNYKRNVLILMTRALYTKAQMYSEVRDALAATDDKLIIETSQYDYFWGIGRHSQGHNHLGKIWMNIRQKISQAQTSETQ